MTFGEPQLMSGVGHCAEFCGLRHAEMRFNVEVLPPGRFDGWANRNGASGGGGR